jgi:sulfotransferase
MHFISGLPRSGSTLLASILRQNPACHASVESPVGQIITTALGAMGPSNEARCFLWSEQRIEMLRGIFMGYYDLDQRAILFDNNRRWTANIALLAELFPKCKVVCCVRSPAAIVDSFEQLFQANPLALSVVYGSKPNTTVYERVREIMGSNGVLGFSLNALRSAFYGPHADRLVLVNYDDLARFPQAVMDDLTKTLPLPPHNYRFDAIEQIPGAEQFDKDLATPGMHTLKPKVVYEDRKSVLPPDIWNSLPEPFWLSSKELTTPS